MTVSTETATASSIVDQLLQARSGGRVERCHVIPHSGSYSNAAHQWGVAILMWYLWPKDFPRLAIYCLAHDVPESWTGDIPAPMTRYSPDIKAALVQLEDRLNRQIGLPGLSDLDAQDMAKLKACDGLEFYLWCREQLYMGNCMVEEGYKEIERYFQETRLPSPARELYEQLQGRSVGPTQAGVIKGMAQ